MHVCANCGAENRDGARFCDGCGATMMAPVVERRKLVTSVFCDLSGSTALGERADSEVVFELMRSYFEVARAALERHGGMVEKFIGDAVVGMFGVPEAHEDDALRACRAALEIQEQIACRAIGVEVRIGVNTGEVVAGDAARREMFAAGDAIVLGDSVNVAARLEQAAVPGEVLIGEVTYRLVARAVTVRPVDAIAAKGKSEPLTAYRLLAVTAHGPPPRRAGGSFVGRTAELAVLEAEFEAAAESARLVTVVGDAGVGKSRLVSELADRIGGHARFAPGACLSYGEGITYWAIAQVIRELAGIRDEHTAEQARERVPPPVAQLLGLADGQVTSDQIAASVAEFFAQAAGERPLVVVIDDIHWAEPALLEVIAGLPASIGGAPVLVLCVARAELLEAHPYWPVTIRLTRLGPSEVDALLQSLDAPVETRVRLAVAADGNPLYAEELVAWVKQGGDVDELPTSLNALLGARLDQLDVSERDALERGAVEGELFHRAAVVELSDPPSRRVVPRRLDELTRKDLIRLTAASFAGELVAYRFKHILVRDAAYRATAKKLRATLHERYADWLEQRANDRIGEYDELLGYHLEQAHRYRAELGHLDPELAARAGRHLGVAGRRANERGDPRAAANLIGRATALYPEDSRERLELLYPFEYALGESGRVAEAQAVNRELYERARASGDERLAAWARLDSYESASSMDLDQELAFGEELIATFTKLGDTAGLAAANRKIGMSLQRQGRRGEATAWLERALVHATSCDDVTTRRTVIQTLAMQLCSGPMPVPEATARCQELRGDVEDDRVVDAVIVRCLAALAAMAGHAERAREYERVSSRVLDGASMSTPSGVSRFIATDAKRFLGDTAGAERELETMVAFFRDALGGAPDMRAMGATFRLACLYCDDERWDDADGCLAPYRSVSESGHISESYRFASEARLAAHGGQADRAATLVGRAVDLSERTDDLNAGADMWLAAAEVHRAAGRFAEVDHARSRALELYRQKGNVAGTCRLHAAIAVED
jgi:class 3 adenylate cyclase